MMYPSYQRCSPERRRVAERRAASPTSPPIKVAPPRCTIGAPQAFVPRWATPLPAALPVPGTPALPLATPLAPLVTPVGPLPGYLTPSGPQVPDRELPGLARSGSQSTIITAHVKVPQCNSPTTPVRAPRSATPAFASPVRVHGAASPASPLLVQDPRRVLRAVATPLRVEPQVRCSSPDRRAWQACKRNASENVQPRVKEPCTPVMKKTVTASFEVPVPVPTQCCASTPREVLERDLSDPEKVEYWDLQFMERLGKGEFGEVFRGYYRHEEVAIKQLFFDENMTELVVQDLAREIDSFRHLSHKRLVRFIGACLELPNLCLVTEYMPGGSLHHLLHVRRQKLPFGHALNMCIQIADGVSYLHGQNPTIVHRDLKSLNVVLDLSLNIKICDFGLTESMDRTHITKKNNGGSPRYMAPELFDCKTKITEKIDVWAMGCIFVEVCGGPLPYEKITTLADLTKEMLIKRKTPNVPEFITGPMRDICCSCLSFHYHERPSSQRAFELLKAAKRAWKEIA